MNLKGSLPLLILHVIEPAPLHGYAIAQAIKLRSEGVLDFREGTLYPALHGLEERGLIESQVVVESGRQRRSYQMTEAGRRALAEQRAEWLRYTRAIGAVLGGSI
jgi:PadR family transcriptional regulator, regulatory protein PadR